MAGPALDPEKVAQFQQGFLGGKPSQDPLALAGQAVKGYQRALPPSAPGSAPAPMNDHMTNMMNAADAAKQKYMQENGVDENGEPVAQ